MLSLGGPRWWERQIHKQAIGNGMRSVVWRSRGLDGVGKSEGPEGPNPPWD